MDQSYEAWIAHCFDHPVQEPAWQFAEDAPEWSASPAVTLSHLTRFFTRPLAVLDAYTDAQIDQGLWYIAHAGSNSVADLLIEDTLPVAERVACVAAMTGLYDALFAVRCSPTLGHLAPGAVDEAPLNSSCYMWWDLLRTFPPSTEQARAAIDLAALAVMRHALSLASIACQESALHGLGHWAHASPAAVQGAIDAYLETPGVHPALRTYALAAREGRVL